MPAPKFTFSSPDARYFVGNIDNKENPNKKKRSPLGQGVLNGIAAAPVGIFGGLSAGAILEDVLHSSNLKPLLKSRITGGAALAAGASLPLLFGSNAYSKTKLKNKMVDAFTKHHSKKNPVFFSTIYKATMPQEKKAYLMELFKLADTGHSENELGFMGKLYNTDKAKYKKLLSNFSGKEDEVHQEVMKHIKHPNPRNFYSEFNASRPTQGTPRHPDEGTPEWESARRRGYRRNPFTDDNFWEEFRRAAQGPPPDPNKPFNNVFRDDPAQKVMWSILPPLVGAAGLYDRYKFHQYNKKFNSKNNPSKVK